MCCGPQDCLKQSSQTSFHDEMIRAHLRQFKCVYNVDRVVLLALTPTEADERECVAVQTLSSVLGRVIEAEFHKLKHRCFVEAIVGDEVKLCVKHHSFKPIDSGCGGCGNGLMGVLDQPSENGLGASLPIVKPEKRNERVHEHITGVK